MEIVRQTVKTINRLRNEQGIKQNIKIPKVLLTTDKEECFGALCKGAKIIKQMAMVEILELKCSYTKFCIGVSV